MIEEEVGTSVKVTCLSPMIVQYFDKMLLTTPIPCNDEDVLYKIYEKVLSKAKKSFEIIE